DEADGARTVWWRRRGVVVTAVVIALVAVFLIWRSCSAPSSDEKGANVVAAVRVAKAAVGTISRQVTAVATLAPIREATISPKVAAQITKMDLLTNRPVRAGTELAVLESRDLAAQRAEAAAAVQEAQATARTTTAGNIPLTNAADQKALIDARGAVDNARKTYERRQSLFQQGGIAEKDLEASRLALTNAENDLHVAEASAKVHGAITNPGDARVAQSRVNQAELRLATLDAQLSYTVIRAPFDGIVTAQYQYQGDMANPGAKLLTVADISSLIAKTQVAEEVATTLKQGDAVTVLPDDLPGQRFAGVVSLVGSAADPVSRSVEVWVRIPNPGARLRANGVAQLVIAAQPVSNAVIVPSSAVTLDATNGSSGTVMVVDAQSVAHEVHVVTGIRNEQRTQIVSGLHGGETVVIEGNYGLPDSTKVTIVR
ncbi:MAG TPA: efflux RND transporter periplasmic adaptor subunit, partial [Thermoanaerobaculia bacterium]|nr:efflux RND transporter periplasmic adaptor subunit [Thermoanaerobaculia bacterium]